VTRLGFALFAGAAPEILRASAREAEGLGSSSFWVNHPGATDGLAALALAAGETRRIELGIGVIPLHTRGPDSIVQGVHANGLPLDRLLLGVGSPNPGALTRVREGVAALRSKLAARLVVAALGPQMCRVAGEVADAVLFNWLTPEHARRSAEWVRAGAAAAGRQPPRLFAYVRVALGAAASDRLREEGRSSRLVLQVHDELLVEAPDAEVSTVKELLRAEMCGAYPLDPPLAVDVGAGDDWHSAKD